MDGWKPTEEAYMNNKFNPPVKQRPGSSNAFSVYITGLPAELSQTAFKHLFSSCGKVVGARLLPMKHPVGPRAGFIDYSSAHEAETAIKKMNGITMGQFCIKVRPNNFQSKKDTSSYQELLKKLEKGPLIACDIDDLLKTVGKDFSSAPSSEDETRSLSSKTRSNEVLFNPRQPPLKTPPRPKNKPNTNYTNRPKQKGGSHGSFSGSSDDGASKNKVCPPQKNSCPSPRAGKANNRKPELKTHQSDMKSQTVQSTLMDNPEAKCQTSAIKYQRSTLVKQEDRADQKHTLGNAVQSQNGLISEFKDNACKDVAVAKSAENEKKKDLSLEPCEVCHSLTKQICSSCSVVHYCSRVCQKKDWPKHKKICKELAADKRDTNEQLFRVDDDMCADIASALLESISPKSEAKSATESSQTSTELPKYVIPVFASNIKVGSVMNLIVTDIDVELGMVVCQNAEASSVENLNSLQSELNSHFSDGCTVMASPAAGDACATIFSEDNQWYRCVVKEIPDREHAIVHYIDYGNFEEVLQNKLMFLDGSFCKLPAFSISCKFAGSKVDAVWNNQQIAFLTDLLRKKNLLHAKVTQITTDFLFAEFTSENLSVNARLHRLGSIKPQHISESCSIKSSTTQKPASVMDQSSVVLENSESDSIQPENLQGYDKVSIPRVQIPSHEFQAIISHVENSGSIFCQIVSDDLMQLHPLLQELSCFCASTKVKYEPQVGNICSAVFDEDGQWYRAQVIKALSSNEFSICYLDFGNTAVLSADKIQPLPKKYHTLPIQAFQATLANCFPSSTSGWCETALEIFDEFKTNPFQAKVLEEVLCNSNKVRLTAFMDKDMTLNDHLIKLGFAKAEVGEKTDKSMHPLTTDCFSGEKNVMNTSSSLICLKKCKPVFNNAMEINICALAEQGLFYCQALGDDYINLNKLVDELTMHCSSTGKAAYDELSIDSICAAFYPESGTWNRARVINQKDEQTQVQYIDYGNKAWLRVEDIKPLPDSFVGLPVQALFCRLADVEPVSSSGWGEDYTAALSSCMDKLIFAKFVNEDQEVYTVKIPELVNMLIKKDIARYCFQSLVKAIL